MKLRSERRRDSVGMNRSIEYEKVQSSTLELSGVLAEDYTVHSPKQNNDRALARLERKINVLIALVLVILILSIFNFAQYQIVINHEPDGLSQ